MYLIKQKIGFIADAQRVVKKGSYIPFVLNSEISTVANYHLQGQFVI